MNERPLMHSGTSRGVPGAAPRQFVSEETAPLIVDVREDIRNGREPFSKIMNAVSGLCVDQKLLLLAPFEPVPLLHALAKQGFQHTARSTEAGEWEVLFERRTETASPDSARSRVPQKVNPGTPGSDQTVEVDARGLEPPLPMIKILETLATLPGNAALRARTDRRPIHLYAQLEERGFAAQTEEQSDGSFLTHICRR